MLLLLVNLWAIKTGVKLFQTRITNANIVKKYFIWFDTAYRHSLYYMKMVLCYFNVELADQVAVLSVG